MAYLIGTDEAGYGPNLGPLTVTGTLWQVPDSPGIDLYELLSNSVAPVASRASAKADQQRLHLADSKAVHKPNASNGLGSLELPVLSLLHSTNQSIPADDRDLFRQAVSECVEDRIGTFATESKLWTPREPFPLPLDVDATSIRSASEMFSQDCQTHGVKLLKVLCRPMFPGAFNHAVEKLGNKASVLSATTLQIVRQLLDQTTGSVTINCDKHGGRSKYVPLLQQWLTDQWISIDHEQPATSRYCWEEDVRPSESGGKPESRRQVAISFSAKGESFLPTAVASMVSKYLREIYMEIWNEYWIEFQPDLKPTRGYPVDAKRFMQDIQPLRKSVSIPDRLVWRNR